MSELNLFATNEVVEKEITIKGEKGSVFVRKLPAIELRRFHEETMSDDMDVRLNAGFRVLAKAIRREDGTPRMTFDQAKTLSAEAVKELMRVFVDVNKPSSTEDAGND